MSKIKTGLSAIAREVLNDVQKEAEAIVLNSEREAKDTLKAAKEEADKIYTTALAEATVRIEAENKRIRSLSEVEARNLLLETKETAVDAAFERAFIQLKVLANTDAYHSYLLKFIEEAVNKIGAKNLVVQVNQTDKTWLAKNNLSRLSRKLHIDLRLAEETENFIGGCKIQTADGKIVLDNTLENRLEQLKPTLRSEVARILFAKEGQENAS